MDIREQRKQFSKNLRVILSQRGIKSKDLAHELNLPATTISSWTTCRHLPDFDRLLMLCDYLDMPVSELVGDSRYQSTKKAGKDLRDLYIRDLEAKVDELKRCVNVVEEGSVETVLTEWKRAGVTKVTLDL